MCFTAVDMINWERFRAFCGALSTLGLGAVAHSIMAEGESMNHPTASPTVEAASEEGKAPKHLGDLVAGYINVLNFIYIRT